MTSTASEVLSDVFATIYDQLGFGAAVADATFRDLVFARVVEPTSVLVTRRVLTLTGRKAPSYTAFGTCGGWGATRRVVRVY